MGVELDLREIRAFRWLDVTGMVSVGDWKWDSNATDLSIIRQAKSFGRQRYSRYSIGARIILNLHYDKGIKVGGSAQTTAALGLVQSD